MEAPFLPTIEEGEEITKYFHSIHEDKILTKNEIASAVRRFIIRYLLNDNELHSKNVIYAIMVM